MINVKDKAVDLENEIQTQLIQQGHLQQPVVLVRLINAAISDSHWSCWARDYFLLRKEAKLRCYKLWVMLEIEKLTGAVMM